MSRRYCPRCGLALRDGDVQTCVRCGLVFAAADPARANFDEARGLSLRDDEVPLRCWHCGEPIERQDFVCGSCGTTLTRRGSAAELYDVAPSLPARPPAPPEVVPAAGQPCRHCGFELDGEAMRCPRCGALQSDLAPDDPGGLPEAPPPARKRFGWNILARHWRGDLPLGVSFWVVSIVLSAALYAVTYFVEAPPITGPLGLFGLVAAIWLASVVISVWQLVGIWRSARRRRRERRSSGRGAFWAVAALVWVGIAVLGVIQSVAIEARLQVTEVYRIAFLGDPDIPDFLVDIDARQRAIRVTGGIKFGLAEAIEEALREAPETMQIVLYSPGGRIGPAQLAADVIRAHGLSTHVERACMSACTLVFAAGEARTIGLAGLLGYHSATDPFSIYDDPATSQRYYTELMTEAGVAPSFLARVARVAPWDMWFPTTAELEEAGILAPAMVN